MKRSLILLCASLLVGGMPALIASPASAAPKNYQEAKKDGSGWTTAPTDNGRYVITYTGDSKVKKDMVAKYVLLRAAEFTQEQGFEWFAVITSIVREVEKGGADDLAGRTGNFMGGSSATMGTGGGGTTAGTSGGSFDMGPSTGGFGGGAPPPGVVERWQPKKVAQAVMIIQMGKGDEANFPGLTKQPDIFDAKSTIAELNETPAK